MNQLQKLKNFVSNNYELEKLKSILNEFNPLSVLKVNHYEIRHSNVLSWLLDPKENHRMNDFFIKKLLFEIVSHNDNINDSLNEFEIHDFSFNEVEVRREWHDIDILLLDHINKLAILIENKIHAKESKGQLLKYYKSVNDNYPNYLKLPVYLTLYGDEPSDSRYGILNYLQILEILNNTLELNGEYLNTKIFDFIKYYIRTLEILTMEDKELKLLCKKLYKEHKVALDLIWSYASDDEFEDAAEEFSRTLSLKEEFVDGRVLFMVPRKLAHKSLENIAESNWAWGYPISTRFVNKENKLGLIIEVGPFKDGHLRSDFLKHLKSFGYSISEKSLRITSRYTRIFTKYPNFEEFDDKEQIKLKLEELNEKYLNKHIATLEKACNEFEWSK